MSLPGFTWRILAWNREGGRHGVPALNLAFHPSDRIEFDELFLGGFLHIEQMSDRQYWIRVGDHVLDVTIPAKGKTKVYHRIEP